MVKKIEQVTGKSVINVAGAGAAGGMGAALFGLLNARLQPGIEIVTEALKLAATVQNADLVITGEGRIDSQTIYGKTPVGWRESRSVLIFLSLLSLAAWHRTMRWYINMG